MDFPITHPLHIKNNHPLSIIKNKIYSLFPEFSKHDDLLPFTSVEQNFDKLLIPHDHDSRKQNNTYYINNNHVLRTHTSAHQNLLLLNGETKFLVTGDVYRRDTVDRFHYPVFHQMEGVKVCDNALEDLDSSIVNIINTLFPNCDFRKVDSYFPFTVNSCEWEIYFNDRWVEVLGCGVIHPTICKNYNISSGWAFGLGLERLAMILFDIPDIRLFWTDDERFNQFKEGEITKFKPYSNQPVCYKDIAFWIPDDYDFNRFCEVARNLGSNLIESIDEIDTFEKDGKTSKCYRISYRDWSRSLTNEEINELQDKIRTRVTEMGCVVR